ncbi:hypothetical protein HY004_02780 [Candidatus Saccharibacteria bacterium]|nr:hypothetical protein [Candidatus Saccharibacteria bacterium]
MAKTDFRVTSFSEVRIFLSEKAETRGSIALATLTSFEVFAAKNNFLMKGKLS